MSFIAWIWLIMRHFVVFWRLFAVLNLYEIRIWVNVFKNQDDGDDIVCVCKKWTIAAGYQIACSLKHHEIFKTVISIRVFRIILVGQHKRMFRYAKYWNIGIGSPKNVYDLASIFHILVLKKNALCYTFSLRRMFIIFTPQKKICNSSREEFLN